jgi:uncharacterized protein (DUF362 family)
MARRYDRREFLKRSAQVGAGALVCGCTKDWLSEAAPAAPVTAAQPAGKALVTVRGAGRDLKAAMAKLLEPLGGMPAFVEKGQTVLIKPNWGFAVPPQHHGCTSNEVVAEVARLALEAGAKKVVVTDNPVSDFEDVMEAIGTRKALKGLGVEIQKVDSDSAFVPIKLGKGRELKEAAYLKQALEADVYIAVPVAKSHGSAGFTGALKGQMGLVESRRPFHWRYDLHQAIADINTHLRPQLCIMDALAIMATDGPRGPGEIEKADTLIAGTDPVAVDAAAVRLAPLHGKKVNPKRIRHLQAAVSMGLGRLEIPADRRVEILLKV